MLCAIYKNVLFIPKTQSSYIKTISKFANINIYFRLTFIFHICEKTYHAQLILICLHSTRKIIRNRIKFCHFFSIAFVHKCKLDNFTHAFAGAIAQNINETLLTHTHTQRNIKYTMSIIIIFHRSVGRAAEMAARTCAPCRCC